MNRIIIENRTDLDWEDCLIMVRRVIKQGRISNDNKQYCYGTSFTIGPKDEKYVVWTDLNKCSDRFVVSKC